MFVNYGEKRLSQLFSPVISPVSFLQKCFDVRQFVATGTLQNALNMLIRQQEPATKVFDVCLREFDDCFLIAPIKQIDLKLLANFCHLELFNLRFAWLLFPWRNLEVEVLKRFRITEVATNREGFWAAAGTPFQQCCITAKVVVFC